MVDERTKVVRPRRMLQLPLDHRGFVVPWFVQWLKDGKGCRPGEGEPDFRVMDREKWVVAVKQRRCWLCGEPLGVKMVFCIGPMCAVNRVTSEPPCHLDCATYAAKVCPFLTRPRMRRNEHELPEQHQGAPGVHLARNPGGVCLWIVKNAKGAFRLFRPEVGSDGVLIQLGPPTEVQWYVEGERATRAQVEALLIAGLPALREVAEREGPTGMAALTRQVGRALAFLPAA